MDTLSLLHADLAWCFDAATLRRHDKAGPRYTAYPTAPHFHEDFEEADLISTLTANDGPTRALSQLAQLQADGLAEVNGAVVRATGKGRPLLRLLAMCFDRYLSLPNLAARYARAL